MQIIHNRSLYRSFLLLALPCVLLASLPCGVACARCQEVADSTSLPDAPLASSTSAHVAPRPVAGDHERYIAEGRIAPRLAIGDKILLGLNNAVSERAAAGWVGITVYEQALDHSPRYGQTFRGFGQRLGAAAARDSSEDIFSDAVLAPILHEDPRYYQLGPEHGFVRRTLYAVTRTLITRSDSGRPTPNVSLLGGNLAGSVLAQAYYPPNSTGLGSAMAIFGGSLAGSAFGFVVDEFLHDRVLELQHKL